MLTNEELDRMIAAMGQERLSEETFATWQSEIFGDDELGTVELMTLTSLRHEWRELEREVLRHTLSEFPYEQQKQLLQLVTHPLIALWVEKLTIVTDLHDEKFEELLTSYAERVLEQRLNPVLSYQFASKKVLPS
jgi:hypothetical protein